MEAARKINEQFETEIFLKLIKGGLYQTAKKQQRINDFWIFCHSTFWSTENFTSEEQEKFKQLIADHFKGCDNPNKKFKELVQRAVMAKRYIQRRSGRYIAKPIDWFNIYFKTGLSGTEKWYREMIIQRVTVPHYNEGIKLLAKAVLDYSKDENPFEVEYYRNEFIKNKQTTLLFLYTNFIMHKEFINT